MFKFIHIQQQTLLIDIFIMHSNPNLASKHKKSKADEIKDRPRFNNIIKRDSRHGGIRTDTGY